MNLCWWRRKIEEPDHNSLCHNIRNALAGIQYERKQIARALMSSITLPEIRKDIAKSLVVIAGHMQRIEESLNGNGETYR